MLLVIFGAGASYDSYADIPVEIQEPSRPPLANQLFDDRKLFRTILKDFPGILPLVTRLSKPSPSLEEELESVQSDNRPITAQRLAAIRFYLRSIMWSVEQQWAGKHGGVTNYKTLLDDIEQWRSANNERVCLVTFNYDKMLEDALSEIGVKCSSIQDYISHPIYKVIKLHGSVDWAHPVGLQFGSPPSDDMAVMRQLIAGVQTLRIEPEIETILNPKEVSRKANIGIDSGYHMLFPAIAIPVVSKSRFECPKAHRNALEDLLPEVTRILTVGWRGSEKHFLRMLNSVSRLEQIIIVAGSPKDTEEVKQHLRDGGIDALEIVVAPAGFSEALRSKQVRLALMPGKASLAAMR